MTFDELKALEPEDAALMQRGLAALGLYRGTFRGEPGPKTRDAYRRYRSLQALQAGDRFANRLAAVAEAEVGQREQGVNGGPRVRMYQSATWLAPAAWPWCAAFVCWCYAEAQKLVPVPIDRPRTAGAWDFERWARESGANLLKPARERARRGDIVVFTFSHIGIVVEDQVRYGARLVTVEGNTNGDGEREGDGVYRKHRKQSQVRSLIRVG